MQITAAELRSAAQNTRAVLLWGLSVVKGYNLFVSVHGQFNHHIYCIHTITVGKIQTLFMNGHSKDTLYTYINPVSLIKLQAS